VLRPRIFTVLNLNEVYLPRVDIELVHSVYISAGLSSELQVTYGAKDEWSVTPDHRFW